MTPANIREIAEDPRSVAYKTVGGYIARIEHFCTGVNLGIYDKKTVYSLAHGYLDGKVIRSRIEPIIEKKHRHADKDYYENIHKVLDWMEKESEKQKKTKTINRRRQLP